MSDLFSIIFSNSGRDGRSRDNNNPRLVPRRIMIFGTLPYFVYFCLHCNSHLGLHGIRNNPSLPTSKKKMIIWFYFLVNTKCFVFIFIGVRGAIDRFYNVEIDGYRLVCKICKVACGFARGLHRVNLNTFGLMRVDPRHLISTCIAPYMSDNGEIIPHKHQCNMATEDHDISDPHDNVSLVSIRGDERLITMCPYALNFVGPATTMVVSSYNSTPFVTSLTTSAENNEPNDSGSQKKFKTETNEKTVTKGNGSVITVSDEESVNTVTNSEPVETEDQTKSVEKQNDSTIAVTENVLPVTEIVNVPAVTGLELLSTVATNNTELSVAEIVNDPAVALSEILPMDSRNENEPSVIDHGVVPTHTTVENVRNVLGDEASVTPLSRFSNIISSAFHNALNDQPSTSDSRFRPHSIVTAIRQATDVLETQPVNNLFILYFIFIYFVN